MYPGSLRKSSREWYHSRLHFVVELQKRCAFTGEKSTNMSWIGDRHLPEVKALRNSGIESFAVVCPLRVLAV